MDKEKNLSIQAFIDGFDALSPRLLQSIGGSDPEEGLTELQAAFFGEYVEDAEFLLSYVGSTFLDWGGFVMPVAGAVLGKNQSTHAERMLSLDLLPEAEAVVARALTGSPYGFYQVTGKRGGRFGFRDLLLEEEHLVHCPPVLTDTLKKGDVLYGRLAVFGPHKIVAAATDPALPEGAMAAIAERKDRILAQVGRIDTKVLTCFDRELRNTLMQILLEDLEMDEEGLSLFEEDALPEDGAIFPLIVEDVEAAVRRILPMVIDSDQKAWHTTKEGRFPTNLELTQWAGDITVLDGGLIVSLENPEDRILVEAKLRELLGSLATGFPFEDLEDGAADDWDGDDDIPEAVTSAESLAEKMISMFHMETIGQWPFHSHPRLDGRCPYEMKLFPDHAVLRELIEERLKELEKKGGDTQAVSAEYEALLSGPAPSEETVLEEILAVFFAWADGGEGELVQEVRKTLIKERAFASFSPHLAGEVALSLVSCVENAAGLDAISREYLMEDVVTFFDLDIGWMRWVLEHAS